MIGEQWKVLWYRLVDGYNGNASDRDHLLAIEKEIFENVKKHLEADNYQWRGTREDNRVADLKVAEHVRASFKLYEGGKKLFGTFFQFN